MKGYENEVGTSTSPSEYAGLLSTAATDAPLIYTGHRFDVLKPERNWSTEDVDEGCPLGSSW